MPFATAQDMIDRYDSKTLGDLATDSGATVSEPDLLNNSKMTAALAGGAGDLISAVLRGERYTRANLDALTGDSLAYLLDINCAFAFWRLWKRKPYNWGMDDRRRAALEDYTEALAMLDSGARIFDIDTARESGRPDIETITQAEIDGQWSLVADIARHGRFYPERRTFAGR